MKEKNLDLNFVISVLMKNCIFIIIAAIIGGVAGYALTAKTKAPTYTATIDFMAYLGTPEDSTVLPDVDDVLDGEDQAGENGEEGKSDEDKEADDLASDMAGINQMHYSRYLISTYIRVLRSKTAGAVIAEEIKANKGYQDEAPHAPTGAIEAKQGYDWLSWIGAGTVSGALSLTEDEETSIFTASITTGNFFLTEAIRRAMMDAAPEIIATECNVGSVKVFESSGAPYENGVDFVMPTFLGAVIGAVIVAAVFLLINYLDDTIKSEDDLASYGVLFLGAIPEVDANEKSEGGYYAYGRRSSKKTSSKEKTTSKNKKSK